MFGGQNSPKNMIWGPE